MDTRPHLLQVEKVQPNCDQIIGISSSQNNKNMSENQSEELAMEYNSSVHPFRVDSQQDKETLEDEQTTKQHQIQIQRNPTEDGSDDSQDSSSTSEIQPTIISNTPSRDDLNSSQDELEKDSRQQMTTTIIDFTPDSLQRKRKPLHEEYPHNSPSKKRSLNSIHLTDIRQKKKPIPRSLICGLIPLKIFYHALLRKRGYSMDTYHALRTAYYNKPTPYQQASYGVELTNAARAGKVQTIRKLIKCGLSANPCNQFGESLIHILARRGNSRNAYEVLKELFELGAQSQVCDDFGRTPLHDACWTVDPCFKTISLFLEKDVNLLRIKDRRGATPFDYVEKGNQKKFVEFLLAKKDVYWPIRDATVAESPPPLTQLPPHSNIILDPKNAFSLDLASMIADGKMDPEEAMMLYPDKRKSYKKTRPAAHFLQRRKKLGYQSIFNAK